MKHSTNGIVNPIEDGGMFPMHNTQTPKRGYTTSCTLYDIKHFVYNILLLIFKVSQRFFLQCLLRPLHSLHLWLRTNHDTYFEQLFKNLFQKGEKPDTASSD